MSIFKSLLIQNWRQFAYVKVKFHSRLTVLTGANGSGKTTILHLLNRHWGWNIPYVSTPQYTKKGVRKYWAGFWSEDRSNSVRQIEDPTIDIGEITYIAEKPARLLVPTNVKETFDVQINPRPTLAGIYVSSHRPLYLHQPVSEIPTTVDARQQIFNVYVDAIRKRWNVNQRVNSPSHMLKQSLISLVLFGYGSEALVPNDDARRTFEGFQRVLSTILPDSLGFQRLQIRVPDVILKTKTGDIAFDAVSGGIAALIDIAWQVFLYSTLEKKFVVAIDEPEAHLHPALQRSVLPNLLEAFPQAQFIVATHNPLVVGSTKDSNVYILDYDDSHRVHSQLVDQVNKAGTANELLRDVLGLESTSPVWVERNVHQIINRLKGKELTQELLDELRTELRQLGLSRYLPEAIDELKE